MTDNGLVISTEKDRAEVQVECFEGCHDCRARDLCIGNKQTNGRLSVQNPIHAQPGDEVVIRIPEDSYSRALILFFGILLAAALLGMGGGYLLAAILAFPPYPSSFIGLACGLAIGSVVLARIFRKKNKEQLYPVIIDIIRKGG